LRRNLEIATLLTLYDPKPEVSSLIHVKDLVCTGVQRLKSLGQSFTVPIETVALRRP
jgi:hypothetical protein